MTKKDKSASTTSGAESEAGKDVSLGPACGVFFIGVLAIGAITMAVVAMTLFGKQDEMAVKAIRSQLIPWVEESELADADQKRIIERLTDVSLEIEQGKVDDRQLTRLRAKLTQNLVLQWAPIEQTIAFAEQSKDFTDGERDQLAAVSDRLLQACAVGLFTMEDFGFVVQNIATQESKSLRLVRKPDITHADVITFIQRAQQMLDRREFPLNEENRHQSVSQVFDRMIDDAMNLEEKLTY